MAATNLIQIAGPVSVFPSHRFVDLGQILQEAGQPMLSVDSRVTVCSERQVLS
jgi:hypothetical protein